MSEPTNKPDPLSAPTKPGKTTPSRSEQGRTTGIIGLVVNIALAALKIGVGLISNSVAILGDGLNSLMDAMNSGLIIAGFVASGKREDRGHPFGHGRFEYIGGLLAACIIGVTALLLAAASINAIIHPVPAIANHATLGILVFSICAKLVLAAIFLFKNRILNSLLLAAAFRDCLGDCLATVAVLIAVLASRWGLPLDGAAGLVVAGFIAWQAVITFRESLDFLLGRGLDPKTRTALRRLVLAEPSFTRIHGIDFHDYGPDARNVYIKVEVKKGTDPDELPAATHRIKTAALARYGLQVVIVYWHKSSGLK